MKLDQYLFKNINFCIEQLKQQKVIAYPTEAVFGLGCDPDSEKAVMNLLLLKQRPIEKGFILIGANYAQLAPYISVNKLTVAQIKNMFSSWPKPVTYVVPAAPGIPRWFTGCFNSLAIRVINHPVVYELCRKFGKPLISTSANLSGKRPCRNIAELKQQFGSNFPILYAETGKYLNPSEIRDAISGALIRQG